MCKNILKNIEISSIKGKALSYEQCLDILRPDRLPLNLLLESSFKVRQKSFKNRVFFHQINNIKNGHCSEDCHYCAQSKKSKAVIQSYPQKSLKQIMKEAKDAYSKGSAYYSLVQSGKKLSGEKVEELAKIILTIKKEFPLKVCLSPGLMASKDLVKLKKAGLDCFHHNLNTSQAFYKNICSTHNFEDRLLTVKLAQKNGLKVCSGFIAGMGEKRTDIIDLAFLIRSLKIDKIPINYLMPIKGNVLEKAVNLTADYSLRILCLFRLLNPEADIIVGAGREIHLKKKQKYIFYPATSIFIDQYLNSDATDNMKAKELVKLAGFEPYFGN